MTKKFALLAAGLVAASACLMIGVDDASAQYRRSGGFFDQLFGGGGGGGFNSGRTYQQPGDQPERQADYSRAPSAKKPETPPTSSVVVMGDSMADWLAYGLEDTLSDAPEIGVVRKNKTYSGLIRYENRGDQEWSKVAREILQQEKADVVVMMLGLNDRTSIREAPAPKKKDIKKDDKKKDPKEANKEANKEAPKEGEQKSAEENKSDAESSDDDDSLTIAAPEPSRGGSDEFRSDRWAELYGKKVDEMIAALKSRGVPVIWVGLPSIRGPRSTSDAQYLNEIYRTRAQKAGIVYVDVWDGFVDENGRFSLQGPDVDGQTRRLRAYDGVHFTSYGARKLAHYVDREIRRLMNSRAMPVALPSGTPGQNLAAPAAPTGPATRPIAGPVMPLTATASASDELAGASRGPGIADATAARVLVKGEVVAAPAGRADDFSWPRGNAAANASASVPTNAEVTPKVAPADAASKDRKGQNDRRTAQSGGTQTTGQQGGQIRQTPGFIQPRNAPPPVREPFGGGGLFGLFR
jgi:hypothetical protein